MIVTWVLLNQPLSWLPIPDSQEGKDLLNYYNRTSHGIVFGLLGLAVLVLIRKDLGIESNDLNADLSVKSKPWWKHLIAFAEEHPLVLVLCAGYTVAMVYGSSWVFPELVDLYDSVNEYNLLHNFSIRSPPSAIGHNSTQKSCHLLKVMFDREQLLNPLVSATSQPCRQTRILHQTSHGICHRAFIAFVYKQTSLLINNHLGNSRMTGSHNRQTTQLSLHYRNGTAFAVAIGGHN